jgi:hypothetical protein
MNITKEVNTENPEEHWEFIECKNQVAIDLGCGRWEHVEFRDQSWPTTPEWLLIKGASEVHAYDIIPSEVEWYNTVLAPTKKITAYTKNINSVNSIREILNAHKPTVVKSDIEHMEKYFLELSDEEFSSVKFFAVETHTEQLYNEFIDRFNKLNYNVVATIVLTHAFPMKVIFAKSL